MPHASSIPAPGFQAIILCGPGSSFPTFTTNPEQTPKALIPIANRPMVWYPIEFCYRMGITNITLIAPHVSAPAITVALNTNPHLTSLPLPKPTLLAPQSLDHNAGTAAIFRLPAVRDAIKGDFVVLPCDLVCEIGGESLLESWMVREVSLKGVSESDNSIRSRVSDSGLKDRRKGGLGVWYETKTNKNPAGEETDFIATVPLEVDPVPSTKASLRDHISKLVYSIPTDTLKDLVEEKKSLPIRHSLIQAHPKIRMLSSHRDAHLYVFPAWIVDFINKNERMESIGEDVIGWWAKAGWQVGLGEKLGLKEIFPNLPDDDSSEDDKNDPKCLSTTYTSERSKQAKSTPSVPPILSYLHPKGGKLIQRVDTAPLLLSVCLQLAKLQSIDEIGRKDSSPHAHQKKIAYPEGIAPRTTVTKADCLVAENVTVEEKSSIKECVIGANCQISSGVKLLRCVLMDGAVIGKGCKLTGCVLGKRCEIGAECILQDCEVQENLLIEPGTEDKNNKLMSSEGMQATEEEIRGSYEDELIT